MLSGCFRFARLTPQFCPCRTWHTRSTHPFWPAPHHLICVSRGEAGEPQSLSVPMAVVNTVILDLAGIDDGRSLAALEEYRKFRSKLPPDWN